MASDISLEVMPRGNNGEKPSKLDKQEVSYDPLSPSERSERMKLTRGKNTKVDKRRDAKVYRQIDESGRRYLVVWECELKNCDLVASNIQSFLGD
jgi:G:T-mismatch repair DNA endonuclease (very short patch repair protein)